MRTAIIGAGLTGLTAARALYGAGVECVVFDKGRGLGGRLSTRRADGGLQFDHGAQYLTAETEEFAAFLRSSRSSGAAALWTLEDGRKVTVGLPGMSGIVKALAEGLEVRSNVEVPAIEKDGGAWSVAGERFDRVICAVPAPQAAVLAGGIEGVGDALGAVEMQPCLTLMLALPERAPPFLTRRDADGDIAWLALDSAKTDRTGPQCWVAQAGPDWSRAYLEASKEEIAAAMTPIVCGLIGADPGDALYTAGHRWRYAQASTPLGEPFLDAGTGLFIGGDWCLSAKAEGAFLSGSAMADAIIRSH